MKWVLDFDGKNRFKYYLYNFMIIFADLVMIVPTILLGYMVDNGITKGDKSIIIPITILVVAITLLTNLSAYLGVVFIDKWGFKLAAKLKKACYEKLHTLDQSFYSKYSLGEMMTVFSDTYTVRFCMCFVVKTFLTAVLRFLGALAYCFYISLKLTMIIMIPLPFLFYFSKVYVKTSRKNYKDKREYLSSFNGYIQENIDANRLVKNFGTEEKEIKKFKRKSNVLKSKNLNIRHKFINYHLTTTGLNEMICALLIFFGFLFVMKGEITIGQWLVFDSLVWCLKGPFENASSLIDSWQNFKVVLNKIKFLLESESNIKDGTLELEKKNHVIEFKGVSVSYDKKTVLKNFNMTILPGKTYALIGLVGSGKSTVTKLLMRFIEPTKGTILIDGIDIKKYTIKSLRSNFGYVAQTPFLFSDTIKNNVNFGDESLTDEEIINYIKLAKANYVLDLPEQIETIIGEGGVNLSGGEKQRLSLARALAIKPNILVLDDITSALDFETEIEVTNNINNLNYECTKVIVAQKILSVKNADEIFVLDNGKLVEQGSHKDLLNNNGLYKEIYDIQKRGIKL